MSHIIHHAADGQRYLVLHGDVCDVFAARFPLLARVGAWAESRFRGLGARVNALRRRFGRPDWLGVDRVLKQVNDLIRSVDAFDKRLAHLARAQGVDVCITVMRSWPSEAHLARAQGVDGIICGHFHQPALHSDHGVAYANCGDWVENSTALAETASGRLLLLDWADPVQDNKRTAPRMRIGATAKGI